jgi:hypothetical protein
MSWGLVAFGMALAVAGWVSLRSGPRAFTRLKAVGLVLLVVGEVLLFGQAWWWGLIGLVVPELALNLIAAVTGLSKRPM